MKVRRYHSWKVTPAQAQETQVLLRGRLSADPPPRMPALVAGADVSYHRSSPEIYGAVVVIELETLRIVEQAAARARAEFPYIPGLLSFREIPPLLGLFRKLRTRPEALICDGHGRAHPRRFGLACHLGLLLDLPSVGCAKTRLIGEYREPARRRGASSPLVAGGEVVGCALRTRSSVKPVFISAGHRMTLPFARDLVLALTPRFRIPETTRRAHELVNRLRRGVGAESSREALSTR